MSFPLVEWIEDQILANQKLVVMPAFVRLALLHISIYRRVRCYKVIFNSLSCSRQMPSLYQYIKIKSFLALNVVYFTGYYPMSKIWDRFLKRVLKIWLPWITLQGLTQYIKNYCNFLYIFKFMNLFKTTSFYMHLINRRGLNKVGCRFNQYILQFRENIT